MQDTALIKADIHKYLVQHQNKELLRFVTVGSVDDGKSTLIGRLLHDTDSIFEDQLAAIKKAKGTVGAGEIDFALLTDGLKAEREQGITIDVAYRYFTTEKRKFIIADTPGHVQYTRNMATGASTADVALILIDARLGVLAQSKRHAYIASMLGISNLVVCVNKMDLKNYSQDVFNSIKAEFSEFAKPLGFKDLAFFPVSALKGDNIVSTSKNTPWYKDGTILNYLETVPLPRRINKKDFALPVQYVNRPNLNFRGFCGTVISGSVKVGDEIVALPSGKKSKIKTISTFDGEQNETCAPYATTLTLEDEIDISRGDMIVHPSNTMRVSRKLKAMMVWLNETPLEIGRQYYVKQTTNTVIGVVDKVEHAIDVETLAQVPAKVLNLNDIAKVSFTTNRPLIADRYQDNRQAGAFILIDRITNATVACGMITDFDTDEQSDKRALAQEVSLEEKEKRYAQKACVVWLTGLPGAGKIILARALERRLFEAGHLVSVLDPEKLSMIDRHASGEDLKRDLELAYMSLQQGAITVCIFTSAMEKDRVLAKDYLGENRFVEIFIEANANTCANRLESLGRNPQDAMVTYEKPSKPDLVIAAEKMKIEKEVDRLIDVLKKRGFVF